MSEQEPEQEPQDIPASAIQDKVKAEEMAHAQDPYMLLVKNAEQAIANGVVGMDTVLEELRSNMHQTVDQKAEEYDDRRKKIEHKKLEITDRILDAVKNRKDIELINSGKPETYDEKEKYNETEWLHSLTPEEFEEIMATAFSLLGVKPSIPSKESYSRQGVSTYTNVEKTNTGLWLKE